MRRPSPTFHSAPGVHVNYQETVLPIHDGVPKQKDLPKEMGGTGTLIADCTAVRRKALG